MEIAVIPSLEHPTLPQAELEAVLAAENFDYSFKKIKDSLMVLEIPDRFFSELPNLVRRLSFTHEVFRVLLHTVNGELEEKTATYPWENILQHDYAVRVKKIDSKSDLSSLDLEKKLGGIIKQRTGARVNLENPHTFIRTILNQDEVLVGDRVSNISKKHFFELKPHKRPFFYPGSMHPKLARCMVNLTRVKRGESLLDPFCGTGGILIEAGIIGARVIGSDLDYKMVEGTKENLTHCGITDFQIFRADARSLPLTEPVDAVATDPPYGISASTGGEKSQDLYQQFMVSIAQIIKEDGRVCMATPHYLDIQEVLEGTNFEVIEQHHIRMHKSLTRVISLLKLA
jgi:tRNA (guanine10-N2)-dimethyltransferase